MSAGAGKLGLSAAVAAILLYLIFPVIVVVAISFSAGNFLVFPPPGLSLRWYGAFFGDERWLEAGANSVLLAGLASTIALLLGTVASYALLRGRFPGRRLIEANFMAPIIIPSIITAVSLFIAFAKTGIRGTFGALVLAHTILVVPYVVLIMRVAIRSFDERIEQVAFTLGASKLRVLWSIVLPNLVPSAVAAWIFAFIISFDEVVVTLFLAGTHMTIPKRMFNELVLQINPTITAIATILIGINTVAVYLLILFMRRGGILAKKLT
jgi:putative spermidine/putrescine transport system permease protein